MGWWPNRDDLAAYMHQTFEVAEEPSADLAVDAAADMVRGHTHQVIELVADDVVTIVRDDHRDFGWHHRHHRQDDRHAVLHLPQLPIVSVASVVVDGVVLGVGDYRIDNDRGALVRSPSSIGWGREIVVTYTHGYETIPGRVKMVVLRVAERLFRNPSGKIAEGNDGSYNVKFGRTMAGDSEVPLLSDAEEEQLEQFWMPA